VQTRWCLRWLSVCIAACWLGPVFAQQKPVEGAVQQCEAAAASPADRDLPAGISGVPSGKVDADSAVVLCEAALRLDLENASVITALGRAYAAAKNYDAAKLQYQRATTLGNLIAINNLASIYSQGLGSTTKNDLEAARLFRLAAERGLAVAQFNLGVFYQNGRGGLPKNDNEAARLYRLAADQGNSGAQQSLGYFYQQGRGGLLQDDNEAARYFRLSADQGNSAGQFSLGYFHETGRGGVPKDDGEAARLYKMSAAQGNSGAQVNLGVFYKDGRGGLPKDDREAVRYYRLAADQGNATARNNLGALYQDGRAGLPKDEIEAARLYKLAADQNNAWAESNLGYFYEHGMGGLENDDREASRLYKLSADQGNPSGQYRLGLFFETGRGGLGKDVAEASRLFKSAAMQGHRSAQSALNRVTDPTGVKASPRAERRVALVIGNSAYKSVPTLPNPGRDAASIAQALRAVGFQSVSLVQDVTRDKLVNALRSFTAEADSSEWALIYYAGHGIELAGNNYLIPVDAKLATERDVQFETIGLDQVMNSVEGAKKLRLILLDACRDNPFLNQMKKVTASRSIGRGLGQVEPDSGMLVVYAAKHGQIALDGDGTHSPFVSALIKRIPTPHIEIRKLFDLVRDDVMTATARQQQPFSYGSVPGSEDFYFVAMDQPAPTVQPKQSDRNICISNQAGVQACSIPVGPESQVVRISSQLTATFANFEKNKSNGIIIKFESGQDVLRRVLLSRSDNAAETAELAIVDLRKKLPSGAELTGLEFQGTRQSVVVRAVYRKGGAIGKVEVFSAN
jgi:TPR repeat protein